MINDKSILAIILARGGSKRLPDKNILPLNRKPLILWSIQAGLNSEYVDRVVVSSNDNNILNISRKGGAEIIKRPEELSTDHSASIFSVKHAISEIGDKFDYTILLQPTSPLRTERHIDEAFELLMEKNADAIISVCKTKHSPLWSNTLPDDDSMNHFIKDKIKNIRSQDLPVYYSLNGAIYICKTQRLMIEETFFITDKIYAYKMNGIDSIDIDNELDYSFADYIINNAPENYND